MSTTTEDRTDQKSPVERLTEHVPYRDIESPTDLASETPLTREAVIHLRAAAGEVSDTYGDVHALLDTVERALGGRSGGEKTLSEDQRMNLARLVRQAQEKADHGMQRPVFERGRGERPHGGVQENGDAAAAEAGTVPTRRLFDVLNVARGCLELAADGELENSYEVSPRTMFRQVCEYLEPVFDDTLEALDRDLEEELTTAGNMLEELARLAEGDGSEGGAS